MFCNSFRKISSATLVSVSDGLLYVTAWTPGADTGSRISMENWEDAEKKYDKDADAEITLEELPEELGYLRR